MVDSLGLNRVGPQRNRERYIRIRALYETHADDPEVHELYLDFFGYPADLPNLDVQQPESNSRAGGLAEAYFRRRAEGRLAEVYF